METAVTRVNSNLMKVDEIAKREDAEERSPERLSKSW